jgi:hypothetical protein
MSEMGSYLVKRRWRSSKLFNPAHEGPAQVTGSSRVQGQRMISRAVATEGAVLIQLLSMTV